MTISLQALAFQIAANSATGSSEAVISSNIASNQSTITGVSVLYWLVNNEQTWVTLAKNSSGNWTVRDPLHKLAASGTYEIRTIRVTDDKGGAIDFTSDYLGTIGYSYRATFNNPSSDSRAPVLTQFQVGQAVYKQDGSIAVPITLNASDNASGVNQNDAVIELVSPSGASVQQRIYLVNNAWSGDFMLPAGSPSGRYTINTIRLLDNAGNLNMNYSSDLSAAGFTSSITVDKLSNQDNVLPVLTGLSLGQTTAQGGNSAISVQTTAYDANSGVKYVYIRMRDVVGNSYDHYLDFSTSGSTSIAPTNSIVLPANAPAGTYTVDFIHVIDYAYNKNVYDAAALARAGYASSVNIKQTTLPTVSISPSISIAEGNTVSKTAMVPVTLSAPSTSSVTVNYTMSQGTAGMQDFNAMTGFFTFQPGQTEHAIGIIVNGDTVAEGTETFYVTLTSVGNANIGTSTATVSILDDDVPSLPVARIAAPSYTVTEGGAGITTSVAVKVTLSSAPTSKAIVYYSTANLTAYSGSDYVPVVGALTFNPGETEKTILVPVLGDTRYEGNETFTVSLQSASGASLGANGSASASIVIKDDDAPPTPVISFTQNTLTVNEGQSGTSPTYVTAKLSQASTSTVAVKYRTVDGDAASGTDFVADSGTITFLPGQTEKSVPIAIYGDARYEGDEKFYVVLSDPMNAVLGASGSSTVTFSIKNDDSLIPRAVASTELFYEGGRLHLRITPSGWNVNANTVELGITYDGSLGELEDVRLIGDGTSHYGTSTSSVGNTRTSVITFSASNQSSAGTMDIVFTPSTMNGTFTTKIGSLSINGTSSGLVTLENAVQFSVNAGSAGNAGTTLNGTAQSDMIIGLGGDDVLRGYEGNDLLDGGGGIDTAAYAGKRGDFYIMKTSSGFIVSDLAGMEGVDVLTGIERIAFADATIALDLNGNGGQAYRLYQAAFNRSPDPSGLGYQMKTLDNGRELVDVASNFINSPEFLQTYGSLGDSQFVAQLYQNVLHSDPDAGGLAYHTANLGSGHSRASILVGFSESPENKTALVGVMENGMEFQL